MLNKQNLLNKKRLKQLSDARNVGLYVFALVVLAITWSTIKTLQRNYELQKQISTLKQQNTILKLQNENTALRNKYLATDQYSDLSARQNLGMAAPGEKVLLVPKSIALKYVDPSLDIKPPQLNQVSSDHRSKYVKNIEDWRDFLLGRKLFAEETN